MLFGGRRGEGKLGKQQGTQQSKARTPTGSASLLFSSSHQQSSTCTTTTGYHTRGKTRRRQHLSSSSSRTIHPSGGDSLSAPPLSFPNRSICMYLSPSVSFLFSFFFSSFFSNQIIYINWLCFPVPCGFNSSLAVAGEGGRESGLIISKRRRKKNIDCHSLAAAAALLR